MLSNRRAALLGLIAAPMAAIAAASQPVTKFSPLNASRMTLDEKVNELIARKEIEELIALYAHRIAQGVSVADLFTEDGAFIMRYPGREPIVARGREALGKTYTDVGKSAEYPLPMIHNQLISIAGDEATGLCSNELRWTENGRSMIGSGYYEDRFRRVQGRWMFVTRDMTFIHWVPLQRGWARPTDGS